MRRRFLLFPAVLLFQSALYAENSSLPSSDNDYIQLNTGNRSVDSSALYFLNALPYAYTNYRNITFSNYHFGFANQVFNTGTSTLSQKPLEYLSFTWGTEEGGFLTTEYSALKAPGNMKSERGNYALSFLGSKLYKATAAKQFNSENEIKKFDLTVGKDTPLFRKMTDTVDHHIRIRTAINPFYESAEAKSFLKQYSGGGLTLNEAQLGLNESAMGNVKESFSRYGSNFEIGLRYDLVFLKKHFIETGVSTYRSVYGESEYKSTYSMVPSKQSGNALLDIMDMVYLNRGQKITGKSTEQFGSKLDFGYFYRLGSFDIGLKYSSRKENIHITSIESKSPTTTGLSLDIDSFIRNMLWVNIVSKNYSISNSVKTDAIELVARFRF